jgi:protein TonB
MRSTSSQLAGYDSRPSLRSRAAAFLLSLGIIALIIFALIRMGVLPQLPGGSGERLTAVQLSSEKKAARQTAKQRAVPKANQPKVQLPQPVPPPPVIPALKETPLKLIRLTRDEFAASDISKLARPADASAGGGAAQGGGSAYGPGEGPGGARLYNAEWYREPSRAELAGYFSKAPPQGSWAIIACQTIDHYHVENCQQLDESPAGSGLSRALRQAAWQFLVRPPRIDGKPVIGAWVRIRFDFSKRPAE